MGKTTFISRFIQNLETKDAWIIIINLKRYTGILSKLGKGSYKKRKDLLLNFTDSNKRDYGELILLSAFNDGKSNNSKLSFSDKIFNYFFTKRKMLFIFDGYDEIQPDYGNEIMHLLSLLNETQRFKIWITTRPNFKTSLECKLNTFAYDLKPFNENDQKRFLMKYWSKNWKEAKGTSIQNIVKLERYADALIESAHKHIGNIVGVPLQIKMFAEIFQENFDNEDESEITWQSCFDFIESPENFPFKLKDDFINVFYLYETFFKKKVFKYFLHEKGIVDLNKPYSMKIRENVYDCEHKAHEILGFQALVPEKNLFEKLLTSTEQKEKDKWQHYFENGIENIGIIDAFDNSSQPIFGHLTYAEYFAACYLVNKLITSPSHSQNVFEIVDYILKKDVKVFSECFRYRLQQELNTKEMNNALKDITPLKFAIKYGFLNCICMFLSSEYFNDGFSKSDASAKSIICYGIENGNFNTALLLLFYVYGSTIKCHPKTLLHNIYVVISQL